MLRKTYKVIFKWDEGRFSAASFDYECRAYIFTPDVGASINIVRMYYEGYSTQVKAIMKKVKELIKKHTNLTIEIDFEEGEWYKFLGGFRYILESDRTRILKSSGGNYSPIIEKEGERSVQDVLNHLQDVLQKILQEAQQYCWVMLANRDA